MFTRNNYLTAKLRHYHFLIAIAVLLLLFMCEGWFLYRYFYESLLATKTLIALREQASIEVLDRAAYDRVKKFYETRGLARPIDIKTLIDPFISSRELPQK